MLQNLGSMSRFLTSLFEGWRGIKSVRQNTRSIRVLLNVTSASKLKIWLKRLCAGGIPWNALWHQFWCPFLELCWTLLWAWCRQFPWLLTLWAVWRQWSHPVYSRIQACNKAWQMSLFPEITAITTNLSWRNLGNLGKFLVVLELESNWRVVSSCWVVSWLLSYDSMSSVHSLRSFIKIIWMKFKTNGHTLEACSFSISLNSQSNTLVLFWWKENPQPLCLKLKSRIQESGSWQSEG